MSTLTVVLTHLEASAVDEQLELLGRIAPRARLAVCHGGAPEQAAAVRHPACAFVDDPTLQGPPRSFQSYHVTLATAWERWVADDPTIDALYVMEYDHLVLHAGFDTALDALADRTGAGFLGKGAFPRTATNWEHYGRFRRDPALRAHLRRLTVREDPTVLYGTLGDGMWLSRAALADYVAVAEHPRCYGELYVPTLLHHLGHRVVDVDAHGELYRHVRWDPPYEAAEVDALQAAGATFVHPVKDLDAWRAAASRAAAQSASEASPAG